MQRPKLSLNGVVLRTILLILLSDLSQVSSNVLGRSSHSHESFQKLNKLGEETLLQPELLQSHPSLQLREHKWEEEPETMSGTSLHNNSNEYLQRGTQLRRRGRGLCFTSICIRDNDLVCERLCQFMFNDPEASYEILRQEAEWRRDREVKHEQISRKVEETVRVAKEYMWKELYNLMGKVYKWISGSYGKK